MAEAIFKPQGPLAPYDDELFAGRLNELKEIEYVIRAKAVDAYLAILGPRQIGKTTLLHRAQAKITDSWRIVMVDFQSIPGASQAECHAYIYDSIHKEIQDTLGFWARRKGRPQVDTHPQFCESLRQLALDSKATKIVVLMDEIGAVSGNTAVALCRTVRYIFTNRQREGKEGFVKYLFVFAGAWDLYQFSRGESQEVSPLSNVVDFIHLADLNQEEATEFLGRNLKRVEKQIDPVVADYIYQATEGHPYLLQKAGSLLEKACQERQVSEITPGMVDDIIEEILAYDQSLVNLVELLLDDDNRDELLELYRIIQGKEVSFSRTIPQIARLELMGLIKTNERGFCTCKNHIYTRMVLENSAIGQILFSGQDHLTSMKLENLLSQLAPRFVQMHKSAWDTLQTNNPERGRLAAHEMRELLSQLLHHLAPNEKVLAQPEYKGLKSKDISRKMRVRYILGGLQGSKTRIGVIENLTKLADEMYDALSGRAHIRADVDIAEVTNFIRITEEVITNILEARAGD